MLSDNESELVMEHPHPKRIGWVIAVALALGGSNLNLFMMAGLMSGQGSAGILLLILGVLVSWLAIPAWTELMLLYPNRVGGIAANTAAAIKQFNPILANLNGVAYWSCTVPGVSFSALFIATAIQELFFPHASIFLLGSFLIFIFALLNVLGLKWIGRIAVPFALIALTLALCSAFVPIFFGEIAWVRILSIKLETPFAGQFGNITSAMAGLYLIAFSAPAFEQGLCYVGEMKNPTQNIPHLMKGIVVITAIYYILLPLVWYLSLGKDPLTQDYIKSLSPVYAPLFHESAKFMSAGFMIFNSFICLISSLSSCSRTMAQLAEDDLVPESLAKRAKSDAPWVSVIFTAIAAIALVYAGSPNWLIAATNFEYIITISLATLIVLVLRRINPDLYRPYRASKTGLSLGLLGVSIWFVALALGFQQFGLLAILAGIAFPFSGLILYFWRVMSNRIKKGESIINFHSLQFKLTGTVMIVLALDSIGYLIAVYNLPTDQPALIAALEDIFVVVALLTIAIGLLIPGMVAHAATKISEAAKLLVSGTLSDFTQAMQALGRGELEQARAQITINPINIASQDEIGRMAISFNELQATIAEAAVGLDGARDGLSKARNELLNLNLHLEERVIERTEQLKKANDELKITLENLKLAQDQLIESGKMAALGNLVAGVAHEVNTPLGVCIAAISQLKSNVDLINQAFMNNAIKREQLKDFIASSHEGFQLIETNLKRASDLIKSFKQISVDSSVEQQRDINLKDYLEQIILSLKPIIKQTDLKVEIKCPVDLVCHIYPSAIFQVITILVVNSIEHGYQPKQKGNILLRVQSIDDKIILDYFDDGKGVSSENLNKVFEPFFTTRRALHNVGLGLSIAYNLVTQMLHGSIRCISADKGAHFYIEFPAALHSEV